MLTVSKLCHLSKTHSPTHHTPKTHTHLHPPPILTPSDLHTNINNTPTDPPTHTTITTTLSSPTHKMATSKTSVFVFVLFFSKKLTQSNSLCPYIWIGTNQDWVNFGKLTGFQGIHLVLSFRLYFFLDMYKCLTI